MINISDGDKISITQYQIDMSTYTETDNPISNAISEHIGNPREIVIDTCVIRESVGIFKKGTGKLSEIFTTTELEDWYIEYLSANPCEPIIMRVFTRDDDDLIENLGSDILEDDPEFFNEQRVQLWIGIHKQ